MINTSRKYEELHPYFPESMPDEDEAYFDGVTYKRIDNYPDYYISTDVVVLSYRGGRRYPRILHTYPNQHGHRYVDLHNENGRYKVPVHRLMAEAFIPNPNNYPIVRHLDDDPNYNHLDNLAWGTQSDNIRDSIRNGGFYTEPVYCIEDDLKFRSVHEAARYYNVTPASIVHVCKGKTNSCVRKHFCYLRDIDSIDRSKLIVHTGFKPIWAISPDGEEIFFESRKAASEYLGIPDCGISSVISGHLKHTHGWKFREA